jgi:hypothetical protein
MTMKPVRQPATNLSNPPNAAPSARKAERDANDNIDLDAIKARHELLCENPACYMVIHSQDSASLAWLYLNAGNHGFWFCSWGCLRDYCNATVIG